ncbi:hypothetical protein [Roseospirillum parvum]|uniref:Uncharacterized protein n=1 Tax=Roseospirillum parvum TaxID=83401 RepID=A0A1G8EXK5_9PROT|nr:hypothetical protein [Roseospirillum parvum]SDH74631.1 hypothetical protein SAMN05421742_11173 [Roseospirillum parvum]
MAAKAASPTPDPATPAAPSPGESDAAPPAPLTAAQAAKAVGVAVEEVFAFRDHGERLVVVTVDGRKLAFPPAPPAGARRPVPARRKEG